MDQPLPTFETVDLARVARLVRPFETLESRATRRPGGGWSIGFGHTRSARADAEVTRDEAEALLTYDLRHVAQAVRSAIFAPVNRNQLEALVAFAFHIGTENFLNSTALHRLNAGDSLGAACEIERWRCADLDGEAQVVDVLVRRRAAEKAHFLTPPEGFPKASRIRLRPQFDTSSLASMGEASEGDSSATLAAAHSVSARLRALVPDPVDRSEPSPTLAPQITVAQESEAVPEAVVEPPSSDLSPAQVFVAPVAGADALVLARAFDSPEAEVPPPPMPLAGMRPATPDPVSPNVSAPDVWPSFTTNEIGAGDPFTLDGLDATSIEAPPLDRSAPTSSLFRAKPQPRVEISAKPAPSRSSSWSRAGRTTAPAPLLWACLLIGAAAFLWSIWSIFKTSPGLENFVVGLVGIALMAVPAYLLLGSKAAGASAGK